ncbi:hypothetical protein WMW72_16050, partial [Paenibacillus filicis]
TDIFFGPKFLGHLGFLRIEFSMMSVCPTFLDFKGSTFYFTDPKQPDLAVFLLIIWANYDNQQT